MAGYTSNYTMTTTAYLDPIAQNFPNVNTRDDRLLHEVVREMQYASPRYGSMRPQELGALIEDIQRATGSVQKKFHLSSGPNYEDLYHQAMSLIDQIVNDPEADDDDEAQALLSAWEELLRTV